MRTIVLLSVLASTAAITAELQGSCVVDGAEAVSDALDGAMYIWASIARCGHTGEMVKCEIGVSSAITSTNSMINVILKAVDKCGALDTVNKECGMAASELTKHAGGITASTGSIIQKCFQGKVHGLNWNHADPAMCVVDIKNTAKSLFKMIKAFLKLEDNCAKDEEHCAANALQIVGAFAGIGEYLAGSVGKCATSGKFAGALCATASERLVQQLTDFSQRAIVVSQKCAVESPAPTRLYSTGKIAKQAQGSGANLALVALLPITAIVGFVGGRAFGSRGGARSTHAILPVDA